MPDSALELRGDDAGDCRVVLSDAPLVEGLVAAVTLAAAGAPLDEVAADVGQAGHIKTTLLNVENPVPGSPAHGAEPHTAVGGIELVSTTSTACTPVRPPGSSRPSVASTPT